VKTGRGMGTPGEGSGVDTTSTTSPSPLRSVMDVLGGRVLAHLVSESDCRFRIATAEREDGSS
jgi:hypothetical protein